MSKNPEGSANYANKPKTFEEHIKELKDLLSSLPTDENDTSINNDEKYEQDLNEARNAVLEAFNKNKNNTNNDERITSCKNRVFKSEFGPRYDDSPNVFRTNETSVYRITGIDQIADIINCGYVRSKEGKVKGGHENEVFWSAGGDKLNFIDERPILETSIDAVKDGQIGALSLNDLTAVWIFDSESGKRENKLDAIKDIKRFIGKDEQISVEELNKKIKME
ncbi:hypothetical protein IKG05_01275 [Candidatus Saccharibacteria bacterium]|nr:hypothetical protein [Candidatus Saccharibacteria bacterium]